jgi:hypothetical protein
MSTKPTAVAIAGYNRPAYFRPTMRSLLSNNRIADCDLWCFFDGGPESRQHDYARILSEELSQSAFAPRKIHFAERSENWGCEKNLIDARRELFDHQGYERVFVFEDDMIVGPHYLTLTERLLEWAMARFSDIGVAQAYNPCRAPLEEKVCRLDEAEVGNPHWWGYLTPRRTWHAIRETLYEYDHEFLTKGGDRRLDHKRIRNWAIAKLRVALQSAGSPSEIFQGERRFPQSWDFYSYFEGPFATGQDAITVLAMTLAGLQKICTTVNRARPIGAAGLHSTVEVFTAAGLDEIELHNFASDATRTDFRVRALHRSKIMQMGFRNASVSPRKEAVDGPTLP